MSANPASAIDLMKPVPRDAEQAAMHSTMRKQRIQDFIFHKTTMLFSASVLFVLIGIIVSRSSAPFQPSRNLASGSSPASNGIPSMTSTARPSPSSARWPPRSSPC
jgi:hypothetical protein